MNELKQLLEDIDISKLENLSQKGYRVVDSIITAYRDIEKSLKYLRKKATVKRDTTWIYKGCVFEIIGVHDIANERNTIYPIGSAFLILNLVGTKFEKEKSINFTIINEEDLIIND
mgnify:CR=1 FL=1